MKLTSLADWNCSIAKTLDVVGEWWTLLIIRDAFGGTRRFDDFQSSPGLARSVPTARPRRPPPPGGRGSHSRRLRNPRPPGRGYRAVFRRRFPAAGPAAGRRRPARGDDDRPASTAWHG